MIFKKIRLTNFRQFKDTTEIEFSTNNERNVTIILGDNGAGKTTFLQAFNWCLYGQLKLENPNDLINKDVMREIGIGDKATCEVSVELEHLNKIYTCRNFITYIRNSDGNIKKLDEGQIFTVKDPQTGETKRTNQNAIREIFPSDLSTYFLFDGERMQDLADNQRLGKKDLSNAVKNLMGLDVLENGKYHLEKAKKEFETEFVSDSSTRLTEINEELKQLDESIEIENKNKARYEEELIDLEKKQSKVSEILKSYSGLKELQEKRESYAKRLDLINFKIESKKTDIFKGFGSVGPNFFLGKSLDILQEKIKKSELHDKGIEGINGAAIEQILRQGKCICGCDLNLNTNAKTHLEELKKFLPPESFATLLKGLEVNIKNTKENNELYYDNFNRYYDEYNKLLNERDELINLSKDNDKLIADIGDQDLSKFNQEYLELNRLIANKNQAIGSARNQIDNYEQIQRNRESERSNIKVSNDTNEYVQLKVDICQNLIDEINNRLHKKEKEVKDELQDKTSELLSKMLTSNKEIEIGEDYNFTVYDKFRTSTLSEGEKIVTSFAFVGSIISVAKDVIDATEDSKFTLVMDAPFAKLDSTHRKNVTQLIPTLTDQIILLSADSQWDDDVQASLENKIGRIYEIKKIESGISTIEFVKGVVE